MSKFKKTRNIKERSKPSNMRMWTPPTTVFNIGDIAIIDGKRYICTHGV